MRSGCEGTARDLEDSEARLFRCPWLRETLDLSDTTNHPPRCFWDSKKVKQKGRTMIDSLYSIYSLFVRADRGQPGG